MQPKDLKELEVDTTDAIFSSSQLMRTQSKAGWFVANMKRMQRITVLCHVAATIGPLVS